MLNYVRGGKSTINENVSLPTWMIFGYLKKWKKNLNHKIIIEGNCSVLLKS